MTVALLLSNHLTCQFWFYIPVYQPQSTNDLNQVQTALKSMFGDRHFKCSSNEMAKIMARFGKNVSLQFHSDILVMNYVLPF